MSHRSEASIHDCVSRTGGALGQPGQLHLKTFFLWCRSHSLSRICCPVAKSVVLSSTLKKSSCDGRCWCMLLQEGLSRMSNGSGGANAGSMYVDTKQNCLDEFLDRRVGAACFLEETIHQNFKSRWPHVEGCGHLICDYRGLCCKCKSLKYVQMPPGCLYSVANVLNL